MPTIIAHHDSCSISIYGPTQEVPVPEAPGSFRTVARCCDCGGIRIQFEADFEASVENPAAVDNMRAFEREW